MALLRGINVGGKNRVPMAELRASFEAAGLARVSTYVNTGSVRRPDRGSRADPAQLAEALAARLAVDFGFPVPVHVVTGADLAGVAAAISSDWANNDTQRSDVIFLFPELHHRDAL